PEAVERGLDNLAKHVESALCFNRRPIVALNRFAHDSDEEINVVRAFCEGQELAFAEANHFAKGGEGALALAELVRTQASAPNGPFTPLYDWTIPIPDKIEAIATKIYGADGVDYTRDALRALKTIDRLGLGELPVCIAKTQASLSDDPLKLGRPEGFRLTVRDLMPSVGAGFVVALTGDIMRMPGLPRRPSAEQIDVRDGKIVGLS
ncbi:MAG TPA: formate--tetrahydrofolate ligase, partial [Polyangiaceae bacterium]|nr:formate--tetrahydrofolate ligase [Polyangiaceae bacterium]